MKLTDDAVFYAETREALGVDPLSGETDADKELRAASERYEKGRLALKEIVTQDWSRIPAAPAKKRVRGRG